MYNRCWFNCFSPTTTLHFVVDTILFKPKNDSDSSARHTTIVVMQFCIDIIRINWLYLSNVSVRFLWFLAIEFDLHFYSKINIAKVTNLNKKQCTFLSLSECCEIVIPMIEKKKTGGKDHHTTKLRIRWHSKKRNGVTMTPVTFVDTNVWHFTILYLNKSGRWSHPFPFLVFV